LRRSRTSLVSAAAVGGHLVIALALTVGFVITAVPASAAPGNYVVNSTSDQDSTTLRNNCRVGTGTCTLRAALAQADGDGMASTIRFNIAGTGPHTIAIGSTLDTLNEGDTTIDGYSQPGAAPNTASEGSNASIRVQIAGPGMVQGGVRALVIMSPRNTIRGLAIYNMFQDIHLGSDDASNNEIAGNFLGTNAAGTFGATSANNATFGVVVLRGADHNTIGGPDPADRNVISGHAGRGVIVGWVTSTADVGTDANLVQGNIVGLTPSGSDRRPNWGHGIDVNNGATGNRVVGNVVSGNNAEGIEVSHGRSTSANEVIGNRVGTNLAGTAGPAYARNTSTGIHVEDGPDLTVVRDNVVGNNGGNGLHIGSLTHSATRTQVVGNRIGVSLSGAAIGNVGAGIRIRPGFSSSNQAAALNTVIGVDNVIANNGAGITVEGELSRGNKITRNSIFANARLGIDLTPIGQVNQNDGGDGDDGPNRLLNWPVLNSPSSNSVSGRACPGCTVEVFLADSQATLDPQLATSYGEGQTYLATAVADGNGAFTAPLPSSAAGRIITATATDAAGNTSEFGLNRAVPGSK
jgi:Bacterial Ig domain